MRTIGYIRVSTDKQVIGPEVQREAITSKFGPDVIWFEDIGVSGSKTLANRPALGRAIVELKPGDSLAVYRLDRVARDLMTQLVVEDQVKKAGAKLISCAGEGTEHEGPEAKLFRSILGAMAEFERELIRARVCATMALKKSRGEKLGGVSPFGFNSQDGKLVSNLEEQGVIDQIMKYRSEGIAIRPIVKRLNESGIKTKTGKNWNIRQIQMLIKRHPASIKSA
jgi:site-specific DNA recombinase